MSLTIAQRKHLREGRKCLDIPRRPPLDDATKCDIAVIVGVLAVLAVALWLRMPFVSDAALVLLASIAGVSGVWVMWAVGRVVVGRRP